LDYDIPIQNGYNKIKDGVDHINLLFRHNLLKISNKQSRLIQQLKLIAFSESALQSVNSNKADPFIKPPKGVGHWDLISAFRYSVVTVGRQFNSPDVPRFDYSETDYETLIDSDSVTTV